MDSDNYSEGKMQSVNKDYLKFFGYLAIIILLTPFLMDIISRSWNTNIMKGIGGAIKSIDPAGVSILIDIMIGFYIGSIILMFIDRRKRIQAGMMSIGIYIVANSLDTQWNIAYIGLGILIGIILGGLLKNDFKNYRAYRNVSNVSISYIIISFLTVYLIPGQDNTNFIRDAIVVLAFSFFFGEVMSYKVKDTRIFVLGPGESGKTNFMIGCYMKILEMAKKPTRASEDLLDIVDAFHQPGVTWLRRTTILDDATRIYPVLQFAYDTGKLFPKDSLLRTIDYPGPYIEEVLKYLYYGISVDKIEREKEKKKKESETGNEKNISSEDTQLIKLAEEIMASDKLIFIVDGAKYPNFGTMGITNYIKIIRRLKDNGKDIRPYIIITKSDLFMDEFGNKEDYFGFKNFIRKKISQNIYIRELLNEASNADFYPVFYYTTNVGNDRIPLRDENRNTYTFGFDKFIDELMND